MDEQRAEFEAWQRTRRNGSTVWWDVWQAATQRQQERIAELERDLQFVERWANHHGAKPHTTAKEALSVIQHYPPITRITRGYADGVVPDTFDPYARIAELEAQVQALSLDAGRIDALVHALAKYDWRSSSIWRYYYPSATGTYVKTEDFRDGLVKIISDADAATAAGKGT